MRFFKLSVLTLLFSTFLSYGDKFPPIPKDKTKLPAPIEKAIKDIANLCKLKTYKAKVARLKRSIKSLEKSLPYYISEGGHDYNVRHGLRAMTFLYDDEDMQVGWGYVFDDESVEKSYILGTYLSSRAVGYRLPSVASKVDTAIHWFFHDWEHDIYRGFYCFNFNRPPPRYKRVNRDMCCW